MIRAALSTAALLVPVAAALFTMLAQPAQAGVVYQVTVDTAAINGVSGNINFQFNPGLDSQAATATVSGFSTVGGSFNGAPSTIGDVTGVLPGTVTLTNSTGFNDYFHPFVFGISFQFLLTLDGPAITAPNGTSTSGSTFGLGLFDEIGTTALLTTDQFGFAGVVEIGLDGTTTPTAYPSVPGAGSAVTFSEIPEPGTAWTLVSSILALGLIARRRSQTR